MKMNINQNTPYRDKFRESCFYDAYKIKSKIIVTNFLDTNGNWERCIVNFDTDRNDYGIDEHYKQGLDNSTDYVTLEINGKEHKRFDRYVDAELELVDLIRSE